MQNYPLLFAGFCLWAVVVAASCSLAGEMRDPDINPSPQPPAAGPPQQENRGIVNPRTGEYLQPSGKGVINPRTGDYYFPSGSGYFNPKTGEFIPRKP